MHKIQKYIDIPGIFGHPKFEISDKKIKKKMFIYKTFNKKKERNFGIECVLIFTWFSFGFSILASHIHSVRL